VAREHSLPFVTECLVPISSGTIAHLNKGLELVSALPPTAERDAGELDLRTLAGMGIPGVTDPQGFLGKTERPGRHRGNGSIASCRSKRSRRSVP
jgi:hypothetical protein